MVIRRFKVKVGGKVYDVEVEELKEEATQKTEPHPTEKQGVFYKTEEPQPAKQPTNKGEEDVKGDEVVSPMPAKVISIKCKKGERVKSGTVLLVIEAMKMEHNIFSPRDGVVLDIRTSEGSSVAYNQPLVILG